MSQKRYMPFFVLPFATFLIPLTNTEVTESQKKYMFFFHLRHVPPPAYNHRGHRVTEEVHAMFTFTPMSRRSW